MSLMLSVENKPKMLSVFMLSVFMLNVVMLDVVAPSRLYAAIWNFNMMSHT